MHRIRHQPHSTSSSLQLCAVCPNPSATCSRHHRQTSSQALRKACVASFILVTGAENIHRFRPYPASLPAVVLTEHCYCRQCSAAKPRFSVGVIDINDALCPARFGETTIFMQCIQQPLLRQFAILIQTSRSTTSSGYSPRGLPRVGSPLSQ